MRWVSRSEPIQIIESRRSASLHGYVEGQDWPMILERADPYLKRLPESGPLFEECLDEFLCLYGKKIGGLPYMMQHVSPLPARRIWSKQCLGRRQRWYFVGQVTGCEDFELGDGGLIYLWLDQLSGEVSSQAECF